LSADLGTLLSCAGDLFLLPDTPLTDIDEEIETLDGEYATLFTATIRAGDDTSLAFASISVVGNGVFGNVFPVVALVTGGAFILSASSVEEVGSVRDLT
jgi:hypothetical protein